MFYLKKEAFGITNDGSGFDFWKPGTFVGIGSRALCLFVCSLGHYVRRGVSL